ncbi:hypothetical protein Tco_0277167 [Tanacetum coccineum]
MSLPTTSPPLLLPSTDYRPMLPRAEYGFDWHSPHPPLDAEIRRDPDREIGYRIIDIWDDPNEITEEIPAIDVAELGKRVTNFVTTVRQDTNEIYGRLDDAQDDRSLMSGPLNLLRRDRRAPPMLALLRLLEAEARTPRKAGYGL